MNHFLQIIEYCLKREILINPFPKIDWKRQLISKVSLVIFLIEWICLSGLLILTRRSIGSGLTNGFLFVVLSNILVFISLCTFYFVKTVKSKFKFSISIKNAPEVGGIFLFCTPILNSLIIAIHLQSIYILVEALLLQVLLLGILVVLIAYPKFLEALFLFPITVIKNVVFAIKSLSISLFLLKVFGPFLIISVLLPVFSPDLWMVVGNLDRFNFMMLEVILISPFIILSIAFISSLISKVTNSIPEFKPLINTLLNYEYISKKIKAGYLSKESIEFYSNDLVVHLAINYNSGRRTYAETNCLTTLDR